MLVQENPQQQLPIQAIGGPATLPVMLLSGRTGQPLWLAGPLPLGFEAHGYSRIHWVEPLVVEPSTAPDLLLRHDSPFLAARSTPPPPNTAGRARLARISGRTGRILWDVPLSDQPSSQNFNFVPPPRFHDLDGDGVLDVTMMIAGTPGAAGQPGFELKAVSLRDGRPLWSRPVANAVNLALHFEIVNSDEAKGPVLVVVSEESAPGT